MDDASRERVAGWVEDPATPGQPVALLITAGDVLLTRVVASQYRADLHEAGVGDGCHGFDVTLSGLSARERHIIAVRRESDGADLPGSPVALEPVELFDRGFRAHCAALLAEAADDDALLLRLGFLTEQAEKLLEQRAERRGRRAERLALRQIKWRWRRTDGPAEPVRRPEALPPRALFIDSCIPDPARDAASGAVLSHMRSLQRLGFDIEFVSCDMSADAANVLDDAGIGCYHAPWHGSVEEVLRREADGFDLVYLHRAATAAHYLALARFHQPRARLVYSVADLHHLRLARQAEAEQRPELMAAARRFRASELSAAAAADAVLTHSSFEASLIRQFAPGANVHVVPWSLAPSAVATTFAQRQGVAFVGYYAHEPNLDAARWLVDEIMPLVRERHPAITCLLAGSAMPPELRDAGVGIEAVGHVASLAGLFARVRLTVAPMAYGAGVKGKVLESLAAGIPCVCTPVAAEGLDLPPLLRSLVAADAAGLASSVVRLHEDEALNRACAEAGLAYVRAALSESRIDTLMRDVAGLAAAPLAPAPLATAPEPVPAGERMMDPAANR